MPSGTRLPTMLAAALAAVASGGFADARNAPVEATLYELMEEAVCGDFDLVAPDDPYAVPGFETPVRVAEPSR